MILENNVKSKNTPKTLEHSTPHSNYKLEHVSRIKPAQVKKSYTKQDNVHTNTESVQCISIVYSIYL